MAPRSGARGGGRDDALDGSLRLAPHSPFVGITEVALGEFILSHTLTMERRPLPAGPRWAMEVDEDGCGCLFDEGGADDAAPLLVEDVFERAMYQGSCGSYFVNLEKGDNRKVSSLTDLCRRHEPVWMSWECGVPRLQVSFDGVRLFWPKSGVRHYVTITPLYAVLRLESYKGFPSKWFYESRPSWCKALSKWGFNHHILASSASLSEDKLVSTDDRFLASPAVSVLEFLHLLLTWSSAPSPAGGLRGQESRMIAWELLGGLLRCLSGQRKTIVLTLEFDDQWRSCWPRSRPSFSAGVKLEIGEDSLVDLAPWHAWAHCGALVQGHCAKRWWKVDEAISDENLKVSLVDLLQITRKAVPSCDAQLLWCVVRIFDAQADERCQKPPDPKSLFKARFASAVEGVGLDAQQAYDIARYVNSAQIRSEGAQFCSIATDKAPVRGMNLTNSCFAMPDNTCIALPPMVDRVFDGEQVGAAGVDRRKLAEEQNLRHRLWRKRSSANQHESCRPRKRYRVSTARFLRSVDRQLQLGTGVRGLDAFKPGDGDEWSSWETWPHCSIAVDQGSDWVSGLHAAVHHPDMKLNLSVRFDPSHGCHRDILRMCRDNGLFGFVLVSLIVMNLPHSPESTDLRYEQVRQAMVHCFETQRAATCELFQGMLPDLLHTLDDRVQPEEGESLEDAAWRWLRDFSTYKPKGAKTNLNRFMGFVAGSDKLLSDWFALGFEVEYTALELDWLSNKSLKQKIESKAKSSGRDNDAPASTNKAALTVDDRALRTICQNSLVVAVMYLTEATNRRVLAMGTRVSLPALRWHTLQNRCNRSVGESLQWLIDQVDGQLCDHTFEILCVLEDEGALRASGFTGLSSQPTGLAEPSEQEAFYDDEMVELFGALAWTLVSARQQRCLWMTNMWLTAEVRMLSCGASAQEAVMEFKADFEAYQALRDLEKPSHAAQMMLSRSPFASTPVQQAVAGLQASSWALRPELLHILQARNKGIIATQLIEDYHNVQKNEKANNGPAGTNRFRRPQRSFAALLKRKVESTIHRHDDLRPSEPLTEKALVLAKTSFFPSMDHQSINFGSLVSTKQNASWFSPTAAGVPLPAAGLVAIRTANADGRFMDLGNLWLGFFAESSHQICIQLPPSVDKSCQWYAALHSFPKTSCLFLPVTVSSVPQYPASLFICPEKTSRPVLLPIFTLQGVKAFSFRFKSWAGHCRAFPRAKPLWKPAVRAIRVDGVRTVLEVAAEAAWWSLPRSTLCDISDHLGLGRGTADSTFQLLLSLTMSVLHIDEGAALEVLKLRIKSMRQKVRESDAILAADEAVAVLDLHDREEVVKQKDMVKDHQALCASFRAEFAEARAKVRSAAAKKASSGRRAAKVASPVDSYKGARKAPTPSDIDQKSAKLMLPPNSYIWKSNQSAAWNVKVPPLGAHSRSWHKYGEPIALMLCLQLAWRDFLELEGLPEAQCPISGLLDADYAGEQGGASEPPAAQASGSASFSAAAP